MKSRIVTFNNVLLNLDEIASLCAEGKSLKITFKGNSVPLSINFDDSGYALRIATVISVKLEAEAIGG